MNQRNPTSFLLLAVLCFCCTALRIQDLRVRQSGKKILLQFPKLKNRSAGKIVQSNGDLVKGFLVDEKMDQYTLVLEKYKPGLHYVILENRLQQYSAKVLLY